MHLPFDLLLQLSQLSPFSGQGRPFQGMGDLCLLELLGQVPFEVDQTLSQLLGGVVQFIPRDRKRVPLLGMTEPGGEVLDVDFAFLDRLSE